MTNPFTLGRQQLAEILASGLEEAPLAHAGQLVQIAAVLHAAFTSIGLHCVVVGGSALEVHAPGVHKTGDIDLVVHGRPGEPVSERIAPVFEGLGFHREGRHWRRGDLFVEVPGFFLEDPHELMRCGQFTFEVVTKEAALYNRVVGFKGWRQTALGQQAIDLLVALNGELDMSWLGPALERERCMDALEALQRMAFDPTVVVTHEALLDLLDRLHDRGQPTPRSGPRL